MENWDADFDSWDDELDPEFGRRTATAQSRRAALSRFASANPLPPPPGGLCHSSPLTNNQRPSPEPFPRSPTAHMFSISNIIHTYSSLTPLGYGSHPRPISGFALLPPSPPIHKERERMNLALASALTAFDMHTLSPVTLSTAFSLVPSSPLSVSALSVSALRWRHQEHRSLRLRCFLHRLGRYILLRCRTSLQWKICRRSRAHR